MWNYFKFGVNYINLVVEVIVYFFYRFKLWFKVVSWYFLFCYFILFFYLFFLGWSFCYEYEKKNWFNKVGYWKSCWD